MAMADTCPRCGKTVDDSRPACPNCGLPRQAAAVCPACGVRVRKDDEFCWTCGVQLEHQLYCWHCASVIWTQSSFCSSCGAPQPDLNDLLRRTAESEKKKLPFSDRRQTGPDETSKGPPPLPVAEKDRLKIVTVLFADVSGFTKMSESLNPEEVKDIMNECFQGLTEEILSRGGIIDKYIGDCVMALFGAQLAREDDPERAMDAALAMQAFLDRFADDLQNRAGLSLSMRIGINTGKVLAGYVGTGDREDFTVMGDAVNLASRLEHACPVGSILVSYDTYRMTRGLFRVKQLDPIQVKGKKEPVRVVEVLGRRPGGIQLLEPTFRGVPTRMIGRDRELNLLRSALNRARDRRQVFLATIRSPIGVGKSRLVYEFASWLLGEVGCELDFMRCRDYRTESTYAPLVELLHRLVGVEAADDPDTLLSKVRSYLKNLGELDAAVEAVAHLLGVPTQRLSGLSSLAEDPEQLESAVRGGILDLYRARARKGPVVIAIEDLHAASAPMIDFLSTLALLDDLPLMLVLSYRPDADEMVERRFELHDNRVHLALEPLLEPEANEMVLDILQRIEAVPDELIQRVVSVAQGRPLFIEEILADMAERDIIHVGEEHWSVDLKKALEVSLPQSVEAAILSRVDALPPHGQQALQIAAVVGDVCWEGLVLKMGIPTRFVLEDLQQRQFIRYRRTSQIPGEREFHFVLPAVREAVENHVLKKVKTRLHAAIADWVQARVKQEHEYFDRLLGHHYFEAGQVAKALPLRMRAGQKAELRGDTQRALRDLQLVWQEAQTGADRSLLESEEMLEGRVSVARLLRRAGLPEEARSALEETRRVFTGSSEKLPAINLGLRRAGLETARALIQAGERSEAAELLLENLDKLDADRPETRQLAAQANKWRGWIAYLDKQYEAALQLYNEGIALIEPLGPSSELASLLDGLGVCLSRMERFEEAEQALNRSLECSREVGHREGQAARLGNLGVLRYRQGQLDDSLGYIEEAQRLYESIGDIVLAAACRSNRGDVLLQQGNPESARTELEGALAVFRRTRSHDYQILALQSLLKCLRELGDEPAIQKREAELKTVSSRTASREYQ